MKKFIVFLLLCITQITSATGTTPTFSHPVLRSAYSAINFRVDAQIKNLVLDDATRNTIEQKKSDIANILLSIDASVKKKDKVAAVRQIKDFKATYKGLIEYIASAQAKKVVQVSSEAPVSVVESTPADIVYYSDSFEGGNTTNGNDFSQAFFSSAKCTTPLNTFLQVINGTKSVIVKNNDRPNCVKHPDIIDLTTTSFSAIGNLSSGRLHGSFVSLGSTSKNYIKRYLTTDTFENLGIILDSNLPNTYLPGDTFHISGQETMGNTDTLVYIQTPSNKEISLSQKKDENGHFGYIYPLEEVGTYNLVVASGLGFKTNVFAQITVLNADTFAGKKLFISSETFPKIDTLNIERIEFSDLKAIYRVNFPTQDFYTLSIGNGVQSKTFQGIGSIALRSDTFASFDQNKPVSVKVTVQKNSTPFTHDTYTSPVTVFEKTMTLAPGYKTEKKENIQVNRVGNNILIHGIIPVGVNIKKEIDIIAPDGNVLKYDFEKGSIDTDGYLKRATVFEKTIPLSQPGVYLVEVNYDTGFAAYNGPIVYGDILLLLPNDYDGVKKDIGTDSSGVAIHSLAFINTVRAKSGKSSVSLDDTLSNLATIKANDMAVHNNLSHWDSNGDRISGTAKRNGISLTGSIGENVAGGNVGHEVLLIGLAYSGGHRENMLGGWQKIGIGYAVKNGQVYYAQVFGE